MNVYVFVICIVALVVIADVVEDIIFWKDK
jgi:hypothetical protein